jgi:iron complex outermembrane receptor protein
VSGFTPAGSRPHSRDNYSGYVDLSQQILPNWEVSIAGRFEHYTDFGDTESGKFSTRYELFKGLAIRGTVSNGFRAPSLAQEHYSSSSTIGVRDPVTQQLVLQPVQALPVDTPAARALGAKPLKPETSTNYSVGLVAQPADRLTITLDLYQIDIKDRVLETSTLSGNAVRAALTAAGLDPNLSGFYFANGGDTRTRGLDLVVNYSSDFGKYGFAKWTLAGNLNRTIFERVTPPPPQLAAAGLLLIDRQRQGDLSAATPKSKILVGVDWALEPVNATIRATRFGSVVATSATGPAFDDHTDPKTIVDVDLAYDVNERLRFAVGANNVFNTYPSKVQPLNRGTAGFALYNTYSPFGFSGGFYYARASYQF